MFVVYAICHVATGDAYFGSSKNEPRRRVAHKHALRKGVHHSAPLQAAWSAKVSVSNVAREVHFLAVVR